MKKHLEGNKENDRIEEFLDEHEDNEFVDINNEDEEKEDENYEEGYDAEEILRNNSNIFKKQQTEEGNSDEEEYAEVKNGSKEESMDDDNDHYNNNTEIKVKTQEVYSEPKPKKVKRARKISMTRSRDEEKYKELSAFSSSLTKVRIKKRDKWTNKFAFMPQGVLEANLTDPAEEITRLVNTAFRRWGNGEYQFIFYAPKGVNIEPVTIDLQIGEIDELDLNKQDDDKEVKKEEYASSENTAIVNSLKATIEKQMQQNSELMKQMIEMRERQSQEIERIQQQMREQQEKELERMKLALLESQHKKESENVSQENATIIMLKSTMEMMQKMLETRTQKTDSLNEFISLMKTVKELMPEQQETKKNNDSGDKIDELMRMFQLFRELQTPALANNPYGQYPNNEEEEEEEEEETGIMGGSKLEQILSIIAERLGKGLGDRIIGSAIPSDVQTSAPSQIADKTAEAKDDINKKEENTVNNDIQKNNESNKTEEGVDFQTMLKTLTASIIERKEKGETNEQIAKDLKPVFDKTIPEQYKKYIDIYSSKELIELGTQYANDPALSGKYKNDFIDILNKIRGK